jgi:nucleoside-diphosphate-sugar epimerase
MEYSDVYRNRCILVTGGAGCIGSNLISTLLDAKPARIIVLDDLSASAKWNIPEAPTIAFIKGSVLDKDLLSQFCVHFFGHTLPDHQAPRRTLL